MKKRYIKGITFLLYKFISIFLFLFTINFNPPPPQVINKYTIIGLISYYL